LSYSISPFFGVGYFWVQSSKTACPGWPRTLILLMSASRVARTTGVNHGTQPSVLFLFTFLNLCFFLFPVQRQYLFYMLVGSRQLDCRSINQLIQHRLISLPFLYSHISPPSTWFSTWRQPVTGKIVKLDPQLGPFWSNWSEWACASA
jgi:hypothetical protein